MLKSKALLLAKVQASKGVDAAPTAADNAILCEDPDITPIVKAVVRNNVKPNFGAKPKLIIGEGLKLTFTTEMHGPGGEAPITTPPDIGVLFRGCGFTQTIVADSGLECVKYNPHSEGIDGEYLTIWFYRDGNLHKMVDCRGSIDLKATVNEYGKLAWEFYGKYAGPVNSASLPTPTFSTVKPPAFRAALFTIDSYAAVIESLSISVKNTVVKRPDANADTGIDSWIITERAVSGEIDPEVVAIATKDFWDMWANSSAVTMTATVGQTAGNRCVITCPAVQIDEGLKYGDREGILTYGLPLLILPTDAGNDEIEFKFN